MIAGLDEAGRGAWAGPVISAAVILPIEHFNLAHVLEGVCDSKRMTPSAREKWAVRIRQVALAVSIGDASAHEVDKLGLLPATQLSMLRALQQLPTKPSYLLIDHLGLPDTSLPQLSLTRGDSRSLSIAAASIIAKVTRDHIMIDISARHERYGFDRHKGYGTHRHRMALRDYGPSPIHRKTYQPVAASMGAANAQQSQPQADA
jgi:ribonuclease HII